MRSSMKDELPVMPGAAKVFFADEALVRFRESSENSRSPDRELSQPQSSNPSDRLRNDLRSSKDKKPSIENAVNVMDGTACSAMFTRDN